MSIPAVFKRATSFSQIIVILALVSCGGVSPVSMDFTADSDFYGHGWDPAIREGSFAVVAVDGSERAVDPLTSRLELRVAGSEVAVSVDSAEPLSAVYLHLQYDPAAMHPVLVGQSPEIEDHSVFIGITPIPGIVSIGIAPTFGQEFSVGRMELARVEFAAGQFDGQRGTSVVNSSTVRDLRFSSQDPETLLWSYTCTGDYDQNSEVNVSDITPIGIHYLKSTSSPDWASAMPTDGDRNGEVNAADIQQIAVNYLSKITGYRIKSGLSASGPFSTAPDGDIDHSTATTPPAGGFKQFETTLAAPVEGNYYVVVALEGSTEAAGHSNTALYSSSGPVVSPPLNLAVTVVVDHFHLEWDPPATSLPDSYNVYAADSENGLNTSPPLATGVNGTSYDAPVFVSVDSEIYFAVKAKFGEELSEFSNIFHFEPGGGDGAPADLIAVRNGNGIDLSWTAPAGAAPDEYDAYIGSDSGMTDEFKLNSAGQITGTTYTVPGFVSADSEHYFGVKAVFGTEQSAYSNIAHYDPLAESDPPDWDIAGAGIKTANPGNAQVAIEWYAATDAQSPPVTYLLYYAPSTTGIDWVAHQETADAGTLNTVITGLTNGLSYDFGVRARDAVGNSTTNTNFLTAVPGAGGIPFDSGSWQTSELVDDGGLLAQQEVGWFSDIAVAANGTVAIAHHNASGQDLIYTEGSSGNWTSTTITGPGETGLWPSVAFHPVTGFPCIAYHNAEEFSLEYAEYDGSQWSIQTVDSGGDKGAFASLAFDPADNFPAISYFDNTGQDCRYAKWNGTAWIKQVVYFGTPDPQGLNLTGAFTSLAFNPVNGNPGISFTRSWVFDIAMIACWYAENDGSGWEAEEADLGSVGDLGIGTGGFCTALCYNDSGAPYIIHGDILGEIRIVEKTGGFWNASYVGDWNYLSGGVEYVDVDIEWYDGMPRWVYYNNQGGAVYYGVGLSAGTAIETGSKGGMPALFVESDGTLHASYLDLASDQLRYAVNNGSGWSPEVADSGIGGIPVVGDRATLGYHPADGYPMISYHDVSSQALKFADKQPGTWRREVVASGRRDGAYQALGIDQTGQAYIAYFYVSTSPLVSGLDVAKGNFGSWDIVNIQEGNGTGGGDVVGQYLSMDMNTGLENFPGISYYNASQTRLEFALGSEGDSYEQTTVHSFGSPGKWSGTAFNPANKLPGIAYYVADTQDLYFVERDGGGQWTPESVDTGQDVGNRCSLAYITDFVVSVQPWISYYDATNKRLKVAYNDGEWKFVTIPAPDGSTNYGSYSSITNHPDHARAAVAFYDADAGKLWYVFIGDPLDPQDAVEVAGGEDLEGTYCDLVFHPDTHQPGIAYQDATNGDLRYVWREAL